MGAGQEMVGPVRLSVAIVWLHVLVLPHASVATQVRVATNRSAQVKFVTVLRTSIVTAPQLSLPIGMSKVRSAVEVKLVLFPEQVMVGGVVSTKAMV